MVIYMRNETFKEEKDLFYSLIENAVANDNPIDLSSILKFIHQGDFYLQGTSSSGLTFQFKDLKWTRDGKIYNLLIQPQINFKNSIPSINWLPIIIYDENHFSSGDLSMIRKENRLYSNN